MFKSIWRLIFIFWIASLTTACSATSGGFVSDSKGIPTAIAIYPSPPEENWSAYLELVVSDVDLSEDKAELLTREYGGSLLRSFSWYQYHTRIVEMKILVPLERFHDLRIALKGLGQVVVEGASNEGLELGGYYPASSAVIMLRLRSDIPVIQPVKPTIIRGWDPSLTFRQASAVFIRIFGFLADLFIWIVVVAGPFIMIAAFIWWLIVRNRSKKMMSSQNIEENDEL